MGGELPFHNKSLDFYHMGALLFELLCGLPPFFSEDRSQMYSSIMFNPIKIPSFLSESCQSLLNGLLTKNPEQRLGSQGGVNEIKEHPWLADVDWDQIMRKEIEPPFKPFLHRSNFDPEYTNMSPVLMEEDALLEENAPNNQFRDEY
jgi:serine/threonine protein kinase